MRIPSSALLSSTLPSFWQRCLCVIVGVLLVLSALGVQSAVPSAARATLGGQHASHQNTEQLCSDCTPEEHAALCEAQACAGMMCGLFRGPISSSLLLAMNLRHDLSSPVRSVAVSAFYCPDLPPPK